MPIPDTAGELVAGTDAGWQCYVTHAATLDQSCESARNPVAETGACGFEAEEELSGWDTAAFDATDWPAANIYSAREVSPKDGYDEITWAEEFELIWSPDLEQSNTVLCRLIVE